MTGTISINEKIIPIKASADVLVIYKAQFGTDYVADCQNMNDDTDTEEYILTAFKLLWSMAKAACSEILPPSEWAASLGDWDMEEPIKKAQSLYFDSLERYGKEEVSITDGEPITAERLIAYAALAGMSLKDLNNIPLPMALESISQYAKTKYGDKEAREATQADFDNF